MYTQPFMKSILNTVKLISNVLNCSLVPINFIERAKRGEFSVLTRPFSIRLSICLLPIYLFVWGMSHDNFRTFHKTWHKRSLCHFTEPCYFKNWSLPTIGAGGKNLWVSKLQKNYKIPFWGIILKAILTNIWINCKHLFNFENF